MSSTSSNKPLEVDFESSAQPRFDGEASSTKFHTSPSLNTIVDDPWDYPFVMKVTNYGRPITFTDLEIKIINTANSLQERKVLFIQEPIVEK